MSSKTSTQWTETTKALCKAVVKGYDGGRFCCPTFGTTHTIPDIFYKLGSQQYKRFQYHGYTYYVKQMYKPTARARCTYHYQVGYVKRLAEGSNLLMPIMTIAADFSEITYFSTEGQKVQEEWHGLGGI